MKRITLLTAMFLSSATSLVSYSGYAQNSSASTPSPSEPNSDAQMMKDNIMMMKDEVHQMHQEMQQMHEKMMGGGMPMCNAQMGAKHMNTSKKPGVKAEKKKESSSKPSASEHDEHHPAQ